MFHAWLLHDIEELITLPGWGGRNTARLRLRYPFVPDYFWNRVDMSRSYVSVGVAIMGVFMLAAAADGARSGGTSWFYQAVLIGFGIHGVGHLAMSLLAWSYTPGALTAAVIVIPFSCWGWGMLGRDGAVAPGILNLFAVVAVLPVVLVGVHAVTGVLVRRLRLR